MVSKSKSKTEKARNPYTQPTSKVKKKDVTEKSSSDDKQPGKPIQKSETSTETKTEIPSSSVNTNTEVSTKSEEKSEKKDNGKVAEDKDSSPRGQVKTENKDKEKKAENSKGGQDTSKDNKKETSNRGKVSKEDTKKDEATGRSKASSKKDLQTENNQATTQQSQKQDKEMSTKAQETQNKENSESDKASRAAESDKASKAAESENKMKEKEENSSSEESDSEEEESDEEEDPLIAQLASKYNLKVDEPEPQEEEQERLMTAKSNVIDLSNLSLRYNAKNKSALQPILVDYGLPDPYAGFEYKPEKKVKKKKKKAKTVDDDRDLEKEQRRGEYHGRVFEDVQRMRDYLQEDYLDKLQDRVAQQRKDIKKKSEQLELKLISMEQRKKDALKFQKKLQRHDLMHDASHLKAIPKSNAYKMVGLENKLKNENKLRTRGDIEEFWSCAEDHLALKDYLKRKGIGTSSPKKSSPERQPPFHLEDSFSSSRTSSMSSLTQEKEHTMEFPRTLTQIEEMKEPSRPSTRDANATTPWAVTQLSPAKHGPSRKPLDPHTIAKQAAAELDKKHPMKELPPLNCLSVNMNDNTEDPEELLKRLQYNRREKERKLFVKRIRSMYQRSKANVASTHRIMERRYDDFTLDDEAPPTDTWLSSYDLEPELEPPLEPVHPDIEYIQARPWLKHVRRRAIVTIVEESEPPSGVQSQKTSASLVRQRPGSRDLPSRPSSIQSYQPQPGLPLSMDTVQESSKVIEAQCLSTLWTNYLGVGKSLFAH